MTNLLFVGSTVADVTIDVDHLPSLEEDVNVHGQSIQLGGCAYNASRIPVLCGVPSRLYSPAGTGVFGDYVKKEMAKQNITPGYESSQENGACYCLVDREGNRSFMAVHGADYVYPEQMTEQIGNEYSAVYVSGIDIEGETGKNLIALCDRLHQHGTRVYYAPGPRVGLIDCDKNKAMLAMRPVLHMNCREAEELCRQMGTDTADPASALHELTKEIVIVTNGSKEVRCVDREGNVTAYQPEKVKQIDGTGAGDGHIGAFMSAYEQGKTIDEAIAFANHVSSLIVQVKGATIGNL